jgi:hypothetical protein
VEENDMHAVVNKLTLGRPIDDALVRNMEEELGARMRDKPGFLDARLVRVSDTEAIIIVNFTTREALDDLSRNVAAPWFAENVRPYLAGPVQRSVGEVVAEITSKNP